MSRVIVGCTEDEAARVRPLIVTAYDAARRRSWPFLSDVLAPVVRDVAEDDAAVVTAVVQAMVKYDRLLAFAPAGEDAAARLGALFALARGALDIEERIERITNRTERLAIAFSFPDWLVARVEDEIGPDSVEAALARMNDVPPRAARVNSLRATREEAIRALAEAGVESRPGAYASSAIVVEGRRSPFRTSLFAGGLLEMQDEASQLVAELVAPPPRSFVVDACAGAGGKTLALAALLGGKGHLLALDASESKLQELRRRGRRAGASNVQAVPLDLLKAGESLAPWEGRAARVLVDAPCSGLGALRRNPEARWRLQPSAFDRLVDTQAGLLRAASALVAPRGRIIYATCSFLPSEGVAVFERFLAQDARFASVTARDVLGRARTAATATSDGRHLMTWRFDEPRAEGASTVDLDGFFASVARRVERSP